MVKHSVQEVYNAILAAGWDRTTGRKMTAITMRETGGTLDTKSRNYNPPREDSRGLFQINMLAHGDKTTVECTENLQCSAAFAKKLYDSSGFVPWAGTQDEPGLAPFYARFDKEVNVPGGLSGGGPKAPGLGEPLDPDDDKKQILTAFLKDTLILSLIIFVAIGLVLMGTYGLLNQTGPVKDLKKVLAFVK